MSAPTLPAHDPQLTPSLRWALGVLAAEVRMHLKVAVRSPEYAIGVVGIPVILFAMFGLPPARQVLPAGTTVGALLVVSFSAYGIVSLTMFSFGDDVAKERGRGWIRTLRATPVPTTVHLGAKVVTASLLSVVIVAAIGAVATAAGGVRLPLLTWGRVALVMLAGVIAFSTLGFAIAYLVRPRAASTIANLLFLPLSFASGFFFPLRDLPAFLARSAPYLPTYHFGQLAWRQVAPLEDVEAFVGVAPAAATTHLAWVLGSAVVFGAVAIAASRRAGVTSRG